MTRDEKIEALAKEMWDATEKFAVLTLPWADLGPTSRQQWVAVATVAQEHIDAAGIQWTRVEDGLPKIGGAYSVTVVFRNGEVTVLQSRYEACGWPGVPMGWHVLAWAPLPEPWDGAS